MQRYQDWIGVWAAIILLVHASALGRTFTDQQGRTVEAEIGSVNGEVVTLLVNGRKAQFPINMLSIEDQAYIKEWMDNTPPTRIAINLFERDGRSPSPVALSTRTSRFPTSTGASGGSVDQSETYKHYQIDLSNLTSQDSGPLEVKYVLFVQMANGSLRRQMQTIAVRERLLAGGRKTVHTATATMTRTKTVTRTTIFKAYTDGTFDTSTRKNTDREEDTFGGVWVRVFRGSEMVGESKRLTPDVQKQDPAWPQRAEEEASRF